VLPEQRGRWVVWNAVARTSLGLETDGLEVLRAAEVSDESVAERFDGREFSVWDIGYFSNYEGLLSDPTRFQRDAGSWPPPERVGAASLVERLEQCLLLVDDEAAYRARLAVKASLLDREHLGNFHQQLGQELLLVHRESPGDWWVRQKFTDDMSGIRDNLYRAVQASFLERYIPKAFGPGQTVIDLGCGPGYYTNLIARTGASVIGLDPNESYIELARRNAVDGATFEVADVGTPGALDGLPTAHADAVFMSDALLFYFIPAAPGQTADLAVLFADVRRILKPKGRFVSVEPHYVFWLAPWLGDADRPLTVLTEYTERWFAVTPTPGSLVQAFASSGFAINWMEELKPDPSYESVDARAYHFARQFPLWQLYELSIR